LGRSFLICRIKGVPFRLHWAYFLLVLYFLWEPLLDIRAEPEWFLHSLIALVLLSGAILCHELAHMAAARSFGVHVKSITLWALGGLTELSEKAPTPRADVVISLAGPACTLALAGIGYALSDQPGAVGTQMKPFAFYNFWMFLFNLIPAYPLDGGQALRAVLQSKMGEARGDLLTARIGIAASVAVAVAGIILRQRILLIIGIMAGLFSFDLLRRNRSAGYSPQGSAAGSKDVRVWRLPKKQLDAEIKRKRAAERADAEVRRNVDGLLKRISEDGIESLSDKDRASLEAASRRLRKRGR
jgi:Zn-dependent protease